MQPFQHLPREELASTDLSMVAARTFAKAMALEP